MDLIVNVGTDVVGRRHFQGYVADTVQELRFRLPGLVVAALLVVGSHECTVDARRGDRVEPDRHQGTETNLRGKSPNSRPSRLFPAAAKQISE